jgi:hypothetical protein
VSAGWSAHESSSAPPVRVTVDEEVFDVGPRRWSFRP